MLPVWAEFRSQHYKKDNIHCADYDEISAENIISKHVLHRRFQNRMKNADNMVIFIRILK